MILDIPAELSASELEVLKLRQEVEIMKGEVDRLSRRSLNAPVTVGDLRRSAMEIARSEGQPGVPQKANIYKEILEPGWGETH